MELIISLHRDELGQALRDFLPMRLLLGKIDQCEDLPWIQIDALDTVTLVPRQGLRLTCAAHVHYPIPVLPDDFTIQHVTLAMVPTIVPGPDGPMLAFVLAVDDLDVKYLPEFVDREIAKRINDALIKYVKSFAWNFSKTLSRTIKLPKRLEVVDAIELGAPQGRVQVTDDRIILSFTLSASFHHTVEAKIADAEEPATRNRCAEPPDVPEAPPTA